MADEADHSPDQKKAVKRFPLRLETDFSSEIDNCVFHTKSASKHQYILDAVREKVEKDKEKFRQKSMAQ